MSELPLASARLNKLWIEFLNHIFYVFHIFTFVFGLQSRFYHIIGYIDCIRIAASKTATDAVTN